MQRHCFLMGGGWGKRLVGYMRDESKSRSPGNDAQNSLIILKVHSIG